MSSRSISRSMLCVERAVGRLPRRAFTRPLRHGTKSVRRSIVARVRYRPVALGLAALVLGAAAAFAHSAPPPAASGSTEEKIEALLRRIEQLEAELHRRAVAEAPAPAAPPAASAANAPASGATAPSTVAGAPLAGATPSEPFAFADFTWLTGNPRNTDSPLASKHFTPDIRVDVNYTSQFHHPKDDTITGSSEIFRSDEVQLTQLGLGGDFQVDHVHARVQTQFGL